MEFGMKRILTIARNTFRENIRDKVLYNLILFALIMILSSLALGQLALGNEQKVLLDLGLASISILGMLISIFIGIGLVYKEIEKRTVYALIAKPVRRYELIVGKYMGLLFTLLVNLAIMTVGLEAALLFAGRIGAGGHLRILPAICMIFLSFAVVTALALLFSTFSTPALSALFTFSLWIAGHFGKDLQSLGEITKSAATKWICNILYYVLPNFANFGVDSRNIIQDGLYYKPLDFHSVLGAALYCMLYCAIVISLAVSIFMRRDFK
jgi:ABC-type transport system involved in multi-copper enzyme maturation permease subunit